MYEKLNLSIVLYINVGELKRYLQYVSNSLVYIQQVYPWVRFLPKTEAF